MPSSVDVATRIVIAAPRPAVAAYAADPSVAPEWYVNIETVEWSSEPAVRVGARVAFVAHFLGRRLAYTYEITEYSPGERLVMKTSEGPFPMTTEYTWTDAGSGHTEMTLRNTGTPSGFSRVMSPFMEFAMRRANSNDLRRLKQILEGRQGGS